LKIKILLIDFSPNYSSELKSTGEFSKTSRRSQMILAGYFFNHDEQPLQKVAAKDRRSNMSRHRKSEVVWGGIPSPDPAAAAAIANSASPSSFFLPAIHFCWLLL
jgi:hypothetical protein